MGVTVLVPASSANLGPGFDSFGLALDLSNRYEAELASDWSVSVVGEGAGELPAGPGNVLVRAIEAGFARAGRPDLRARVACVNAIPVGAGLGSSSAAIVAGLLIAERLTGARFGAQGVLELAARLEGHPDNVAAALLGGFTVAWVQDGAARAARFEPARGLAVVAVPAVSQLATSTSRALLPEAVPHADAAFNVAHAGLLAAAIATGRPELLASALADRLHEPYRVNAVADLPAVASALRAAGAAGVALSGAGPTVIGLVAADTDEAAHEAARAVAERAAPRIRELGTRLPPRALAIDRHGARVLGPGH